MSFIKSDIFVNPVTTSTKKYAIFFLCYHNDFYVMGLLCALYCHRYLISKNSIYKNSIDLVVMCDDTIYKYSDQIKSYCDRIILLNMTELNGHHKIYESNKYNKKWMDFIVNKWHSLYFDEYDKILFNDIDILPQSSIIYNIFDHYPTPFVFVCRSNEHNCTELITDQENKTQSFNNYYDYVRHGQTFIDAGFILLKPDKHLHNEYFNFVKTIEYKSPKSVTRKSGFDETSLFYFLNYKKNEPNSCFKKSDQYQIPWKTDYHCKVNLKENINNTMVFNYLSKIKPFIKPVPLMWPEEYIWKIIERKIITDNRFLKCLSIRNALYCYLYLGNDKSLSIVDRRSNIVIDINNLLNELKKDNINLSNRLFSGDSYDAIMDSEELLLSYKGILNELNDKTDYTEKCCGLISHNKFQELIDSTLN